MIFNLDNLFNVFRVYTKKNRMKIINNLINYLND